MIFSVFLNQERIFMVYYILVFILIFIIFNIKFVTEEVCIFICFFGILNLISISIIKFTRQGLNFKWQKTVLWFFSRFSFLFLLAFVANTTSSLKNLFSYYFINIFSFIHNIKLNFFFSTFVINKVAKLKNSFYYKNYNKFILQYSFFPV